MINKIIDCIVYILAMILFTIVASLAFVGLLWVINGIASDIDKALPLL